MKSLNAKKCIGVAYLIIVHMLLVLVLFKSDCISHLVYLSKAQDNELSEHFHRMLRFHLRMDGNVPQKSVIFIGDSITQGLCTSAVFSPSVNYGIGRDTTAGVLKRLPTYKSIESASAVVVAIGFNDMKFRSDDEILRNFSSISNSIPRNVPVIFSAILPIDAEVRHPHYSTYKARIKGINASLHDLTQKSDNRFFVDPGEFLVDSNGNLSIDFHDGDGLHINSKGNAIWVRELQMALASAGVKIPSSIVMFE